MGSLLSGAGRQQLAHIGPRGAPSRAGTPTSYRAPPAVGALELQASHPRVAVCEAHLGCKHGQSHGM